MTEENENLATEIDGVFDKIRNFTFSTSYVAKTIILNASELKVTPAEYLKAVSGWIDEFEKPKGVIGNEKI